MTGDDPGVVGDDEGEPDDPATAPIVRDVERTVGPKRFRAMRERVRGGLSWGVGAFVEREGRLLLVREDGRWLLPGGGVEPGECCREALAREVCEEVRTSVEVGAPLAVTRVTLRAAGRDPPGTASFRFRIYRVRVAERSEPVRPDEDGIERVAWHRHLPAATLDRSLLVALRDREP